MRPSQHVVPSLHLEEGARRVLLWLEQYPFQRVQDLVLALAPWEKQAKIYQHVAKLEEMHLIECLQADLTQGKRFYHLSPLGTYLCDAFTLREHKESREAQTRWERWHRLGISPIIRQDRDHFARVLPRFPLWVLLQEVINGLVRHAETALTDQGRRAKLIQWSWLRDTCLPFASPREKPLILRIDAVLAFSWHFASADAEQEADEQWSTLFLLHCPLDEIRLMRSRLDRLLRWRESAERTAVYSQMPPLLVLATNERQAEWWHMVTRQVAAALRMDIPLGAIAVLPPTQQEHANPWQFSWRRLATREFCHIQDLLRAWPKPAVPALLTMRSQAAEKSHKADLAKLPLTTRLQTRHYALSEMAGKAQHQDYRLSSLALTARHWEILSLCFAHPLLSRENLVQLLGLSRITVNQVLTHLTREQLIVRVPASGEDRWYLAQTGLRLLARLLSCHVHRLVRWPPEDNQPLMQRGVVGLLHQLPHTAGVYGFFAQLAETLAPLSDRHLLRWWETSVLAERHFIYHEKIYRFRPDALASVQLGERVLRFWLEWDRGSMMPKQLHRKFTTYERYLASREWARSSPVLPALLCVTPDIEQEQRLIKVAAQCLKQVPAAWCVYTTTASLLLQQGILQPIWKQILPAPRAPPEEGIRVSVFESS